MELRLMQKKVYILFLILITGIIFISGCELQNLGGNATCQRGDINCALYQASVQPKQGLQSETGVHSENGLQIVVKDLGMPNVFYLQPTIKEIQLKNSGGNWVTIWSDPAGKAIKLTPDGAETVLDTVNVPAGTYIGTRLFVSTMDIGVDINNDGDISDKNVEVILTLDEFNKLPHPERPSGPGGTPPTKPEQPSAPDKPSKPSKPSGSDNNQPPPPDSMTGAAADDQQPPEQPPEQPQEPSEPSEPKEPDRPQAPPEPSAPQEPQAPYRIEGNIVYTGTFMDEVHTDTINDYIDPQWGKDFVYDGKGDKIIYDFTMHPLLPKGQHISVEVSIIESPPNITIPPVNVTENITVPEIILFDHFDGTTKGKGFGTLNYEDSMPKMDKAINLAKGNYIKYSFSPWYKWDGAHSWNRNEASAGEITEGSIGIWVNPRQYTGISLGERGKPQGILTFEWSDSTSALQSGYILHFGFTADGKLTYSVWGGNLDNALVGKTTIPLNKWTHVAVNWGPKGTNLYVNGDVDASTTGNMWPAFSGSKQYVYLNYWGDSDFGLVDDLRITNVAEVPIIIPPENITVNETLCVAEGSSNGFYPSAPLCCEGLTAIGCDTPDAAGICQRCEGAFYCTKCGDGVCGLGENICNCPKDCLPIPPANTTENVTMCAGEGSGSYNVYPGAPTCCEEFTSISCDSPDEAGNCKGQCVGAFYCTHCGNGICGLGENKCNCPADCLQNITKNLTAGVNIISFNCSWTAASQNCFRAVAKGTAQGPVGTRLELPILVWSDDNFDCGSWTLSKGALIAVGSTCTRKSGQPETTAWTTDTGGNECPAKYGFSNNRKYTVKVYKNNEIYPLAVDNRTVVCK